MQFFYIQNDVINEVSRTHTHTMSSHSSSHEGAGRLSSDVLVSAESKSDLLARARHDRIQREQELSTAIGATYRALVGSDATPPLIAAGLRDAIARQVENGVML